MAATPTQTDRTDTQPTDATLTLFAARPRYEGGESLAAIADDLESDLETIARELRHAGVLKPWDDPRTLAHLYHEDDHALADLAECFPDGPGPEPIRRRMERYGIDREPTLAEKLADPDFGPEDLGLSPTTGDEHAKYTKRGERA